MIGNFKVWINSLICIGIFSLIIKLIIPNNKLKKYIYSMLSIVTIITVISPVVNILKDEAIEESITSVLSTISDTDISNNTQYSNINKYENLNNDAIKSGFKEKLENDITTKLNDKGVTIKEIDIIIDEKYNIEKIDIKIDKYSQIYPNANSVILFVKNEYDIDSSKIKVRGE